MLRRQEFPRWNEFQEEKPARGRGGKRADGPPRAGRAKTGATEYSDIDLSKWREYSDIETDSLWLINSRERGGGHSLDYHGNFVPQIATQTITRYTRAGEVVLDMFLGSGTTAIEALNLDRKIVGVELKRELVLSVWKKISPEKQSDAAFFQDDSCSEGIVPKIKGALKDFGENFASLAVLHPPYHDIIRFSELKEDLSNCDDVEDFLDRFEMCATNSFRLLKPGRFAVLVIGDKYAGGELTPLGFNCMERMLKAGFKVKSIVVKNIAGNEVGKGKTNNLWRYRALAGGFYIFKHEYVMIFFKPA